MILDANYTLPYTNTDTRCTHVRFQTCSKTDSSGMQVDGDVANSEAVFLSLGIVGQRAEGAQILYGAGPPDHPEDAHLSEK